MGYSSRVAPPADAIRLEALLKFEGWFDTGGQAKRAIQEGEVRVNDEVETRRKRQLALGDVVRWGDRSLVVRAKPPTPDRRSGA